MRVLILTLILAGCSSMNYQKIVPRIEMIKFMKTWYVIAGRTTFLERGAHNAKEIYTWNQKEERIDIDFKFNKDSFDGPVKTITQKGWIHNHETNSHWRVSPFWPLKLDYLIIGLADDYSWTAVGVPSGKYLWIMASSPKMEQSQVDSILNQLETNGYPVDNIINIPHNN